MTDDKYILNFINITNTCINYRYWPSYFKRSTSIISKPNKLAYDSPKNFCSIVLLNILGKLIEKVISERLQIQSIVSSFMYLNQLEGLKQYSTLNALYLTHPVHTRWVKDLYTSTLAFNIAQFFPLLNYQLLLLIVDKARFNPRISNFFSNYSLTEKPSMSGITLSLLNLGQMYIWAKILSSLPFYLLFILPQFLRKELKIFYLIFLFLLFLLWMTISLFLRKKFTKN